jgi:hypothetical protein
MQLLMFGLFSAGARIAQLYSAGLWAGCRGFESRQGLGIFLFTTASRPALGPTQPPIQWVPGALSLGVKRPGREADDSTLSSTEVKNAWSIPPFLQYAFTAWCSVKKSTGTTLPFTTCLLQTGRYVRENVTWCHCWRQILICGPAP